ncbi:glycosylphosphatidylinositol anchor attachment 1 protein [Acanthamoeba castellanii str. Neff]|uniref:Glycosylphosphatidylinositol anchor attachment 1 protein n=1 Tax=Acanthamoeba castellanii (strain ATCC 30010 / Neff) TaxID=1257118 RepID=L8H6Z3_ACACF|nr:glycosylphosphatidylinositol anchor attachment 1 protein [Acanthamoeba castellanii str. Neff]ELR20915.1 glycosylphosphatidylinositol anchor attachment 1 protein [Acanthamoeba castellanii str. Neff]
MEQRGVSRWGRALGAFGCGVASFWFYPMKVADRTYLSENALLPTHADTQFGSEEARGIYAYNTGYQSFLSKLAKDNVPPQEASRRTAVWLGKQLTAIGCKVYVQCYRPRLYPSETDRQVASDDVGYNVYAVLSSPRGDGTESLVLSSRYDTEPSREQILTGPPVLLGLMKLFESRAWRDKEFVAVFTDGRHRDEGIKAWLNSYHSTEPFVSCLDHVNSTTKIADKLSQWTQFGFQRAGTIIAAVNLDIRTTRPSELTLLAEGTNGQLPNLDLINTAVRNARRSACQIHMPSDYAHTLVAKLPTALTQDVPIGSDRLNLLNFIISLSMGTGSGDHAAFTAHRIDCITLQALGQEDAVKREDVTAVNALGRTLEGTVRSINGLIERLHQSFYFYLLLDVDIYVPIGYYTASLWLLLCPLIIKSVYLLYSFAAAKGPWAFDLARFTVIVAACIIIFYLPFVLRHFIDLYEHLLFAWFGLTALVIAIWLFVLLPALEKALRPYLPTYTLGASAKERRDWTAGAGVALSTTLLFLANCSVLNFSFCVIAAIVLSPVYALITPSASRLMNVLQLPIVLVFSPWGLMFLLSRVLEESFVATCLRVLAHFMEYSTLTYTFLFFPLLITNLTFLHLLLTSASPS